MLKFILLFTAVIMFSACAHKGHHHGKEHHCTSCEGKDKKHECGSCAEKANSGEKHDCPECAASEAASATAAAWPLNGITKDEFQAAYDKEKANLNKQCVKAATEYCGKTTKDLAITQDEAICLWGKSHRVTREHLPQLDKTKCDKTLKKMTAGYK